MLLNTCCVLRVRMMSIAISCRRGTKKTQKQITFMCPVVVAISSFQPTVKSLTTMGFHSSSGKAASFILGNITINQKLLIWQDGADKEGSLYFPSLKPLWQKVTQFFLRGREIQSYRSWHLGWRGDRHRWTGLKPCTEQQRLGSAGKKKKEEKLIDTDRKLSIPNWNKHPVSRTDNKLS